MEKLIAVKGKAGAVAVERMLFMRDPHAPDR